MAFIDDYKSTLIACLEKRDLKSAEALIYSFHKTHFDPDAECLYLESAFYYYAEKYVFSLYYADMCFAKDPSFEPIREIINYLTGYSDAFDNYIPTFPRDVSSYNRHLKILGYNGYLPIVDYTVNLLKDIFVSLGHDVQIIDVKHGYLDGSTVSIDTSLLMDLDLIYEFNNMGLSFIDSNQHDITVDKNIPIYSYMFDSPLFFASDFINYPPNMTAILPDRNHVKYINRFYPSVKDAFFVPLGSEEKQIDSIPWNERSINCIYLGSLKEPPEHLEDDFSNIVFEFQKKHTDFTTEDAIEACFRELSHADYIRLFPDLIEKYPTKPVDEEFLLRLNAHYCFCDLKINSFFRKRLVEVLVENGIDVEVYGNGWTDEKLLSNPHFKFGGLISQDECIKKMHNSKFILNSMPWFKDGTHDRIYNAMLAKGLCVTDKSKYLCEEFTDGEDIILYDLNHMDLIPDIIRYYEANSSLVPTILEKAYDKCVLKHSWFNRAVSILEHLLY